jgi:osmotically-inducible protein OsmY
MAGTGFAFERCVRALRAHAPAKRENAMVRTSDEQVAREIEHALGQLPNVDLRNVRVRVDKGQTQVQGVVGSAEEKQAIMRAIAEIGGVESVNAGIAVETAEPG